MIQSVIEKWASVQVNSIASVLILALTNAAVLLRHEAYVDPALVGLAVVYSLQLMGLCSWTIKQFANVESYMTSTERLMQLREILPEEHPHHSAPASNPNQSNPLPRSDHTSTVNQPTQTNTLKQPNQTNQVTLPDQPAPEWPTQGHLVVSNLNFR